MKKKRIIIMSIISLILVLSIATVYAAYTYVRKIRVNSKVGIIDIDSKSFYNYSKYSNDSTKDNYLAPTAQGYARKIKLRKDTVAVFEGITFNSDIAYQPVSTGQFQQGVTYYLPVDGVDGEYEAQVVTIGRQIDKTYYIQVKTYTGINSVTTKYDSDAEDLITEVNNTTKKITVKKEENSTTSTLFTISFTVDSELGAVKTASVDNEDDYQAVINANGNGIVIIDKTVENNHEEISADEAYTCSATELKYNSNDTYLSQLGLHFTFTSEVAVYVRIHIQDAWKRTRVYATNESSLYILKDQINGKSPFTVSDSDWYFDPNTNYAYLKTMYVPQADENGVYPQQEFTFNVNEAYYYNDESTSAYTQHIDVEVKFTVDIVQANRVLAKWHLDPSVEFDS